MNHSPAQILAEVLTGSSGSPFIPFGDSGEWPLFVSSMPETNDDSVGAIYDTAGIRHGRLLSGEEIHSWGVQIKVRGYDYEETWSKITEVASFVETLLRTEVVLDSSTYEIDCVNQTSAGVISLGMDESRRTSFALNLLVLFREGDE